jgi:hypothetical protein
MMHFNDSLKRDPSHGHIEENLNPFSMSYAAMAGIDMPPVTTAGGYEEQNQNPNVSQHQHTQHLGPNRQLPSLWS